MDVTSGEVLHATMTNYLITGSSGFVGRQLYANLQGLNHEIATLSRSPDCLHGVTQHWQCDLLAHQLPPKLLHGIDVVVHLAGLAHQPATRHTNTQPYFELNCDATVKLANAAVEAGVKRFLFVSSVKAAGYDHAREPNDETVSALPDDAYGLSKRRAEQALLDLPQAEMDIIIVRPSLVYGPGVKGNLSSMLRGVKRGWFPRISGGGIRSMVSVHDLCTALIDLSHADGVANATFIVTDSERYTIERIGAAMQAAFASRGRGLRLRARDLHRVAALNHAVKRRLGVALPINAVIDRLCGSAWYSSAHLQRAIDWRPRLTLEDLLPAMVQTMAVNSD